MRKWFSKYTIACSMPVSFAAPEVGSYVKLRSFMSCLPFRLHFYAMILRKYGMILEIHAMFLENHGILLQNHGMFFQNHGTIFENHGMIMLGDPSPRKLQPYGRVHHLSEPTPNAQTPTCHRPREGMICTGICEFGIWDIRHYHFVPLLLRGGLWYNTRR